ncbi:MAG: outer rane biosynthesis protein TonB, partial [Spartobacteria bacterium]|nr:outer rane biosynthesis protein TonB [Spartobacteria bacterium]
MTSAEMMFSPVGELATERKQEARKIVWALAAAVVIHLIVGYVLAILGGVRPAPAPVEDNPVELTIVDTSPAAPVKPKNNMFMETDPARETKEAPKEKTFESNANSIAASQAAATGGLPLPSQEGKDRPSVEFDTQHYSVPNQGVQAQPTVAPQETPKPSQAPTIAPTPAADQLAMLTKRPTPPPPQPQRTPAPQQPSSAYRPEKQQTRISGSISNRGISSVNALGTPLGRYEKILKDAIGSRWYAYVQSRNDLVTIGTVQVHFFIDRSGTIKNLKIIENTSNETFANICLQSIIESHLPPIP